MEVDAPLTDLADEDDGEDDLEVGGDYEDFVDENELTESK
jgi:hypothetical protein